MTVTVELFARLRELCENRASVQLEVAEPATAADAFEALCRRFPAARPYRGSLAVAVGEEYAGWDSDVGPGDRLSFIPPVSGG